MGAELVRELPPGDGWPYEPKWDGFRGVLENDRGELALWSRNARPLLRYFPELRPLGDKLPPHSAIDGEIVIERGGRLDFDALQRRLHQQPLEERRTALEKLPFTLPPATRDPRAAKRWLDRLDAVGLDGVIAKRLGLPYLPGSREAVVKVKAHKTADCVVVGVRWKTKPTHLATLLLGLYRDDGELDYVGTAAVGPSRHDEILKRIRPLLKGAPDRGFSEPNRWGSGELAQSAVKPKLVVEVRYDKVQGHRFRHGTKLIRFREDKDPEQCTWREVREPPGKLTVAKLLAG